MKKHTIALLSFVLIVNANSISPIPTDNESVKKNIYNGMANTNESVVGTNDSTQRVQFYEQKKEQQTYQQPRQVKKENFDEAILLNWNEFYTQNADKKNHTDTYKVSFITKEDKTSIEQKIKASTNSTPAKTSNQAINKLSTVGENYVCLVGKTYDISSLTTKKLIEVTCKTRELKYAEIGIELVPSSSDKALYGTAKYLIDEKGVYYMLDQDLSMVKNSNSDDTNIATNINDRKLELLRNKSVYAYSQSMSQSAKDYIEADKAYRTQTETTTDQNGNVIQTSNTAKPDITTNLVYGLVDGTFKTAELITENLKDELPYLFQLEESSLLNVFAVTKQEKDK
jgi:hypothetical protein